MTSTRQTAPRRLDEMTYATSSRDVWAALDRARQILDGHALTAAAVTGRSAVPGRRWVDTDGSPLEAVPAGVELDMTHDAAAWWRLCAVLGAGGVLVRRDACAVRLDVRVVRDGMAWSVTGCVPRGSGRGVGGETVKWFADDPDQGMVGFGRMRDALVAIGCHPDDLPLDLVDATR